MSDIVMGLLAIEDPTVRARACQTFLANGQSTIRRVRSIRDDAIRQARPTATIDALAAAIGCRRNVVVDALRGGR